MSGTWNRQKISALRKHLGVTQTEMARELGTRQQTISDWELGIYEPRGMSVRLLTVVAEKCDFEYAGDSYSLKKNQLSQIYE
jgi:DNA-binding transcriptional regulator YiaG